MMKRQGDVLLKPVDKMPSNVTPLGEQKGHMNIVAFGESMNHAHQISGGTVFVTPDGRLFVECGEDARLNHIDIGTKEKADHEFIPLEDKYYEVVPQVEYDVYAKAAALVRD